MNASLSSGAPLAEHYGRLASLAHHAAEVNAQHCAPLYVDFTLTLTLLTKVRQSCDRNTPGQHAVVSMSAERSKSSVTSAGTDSAAKYSLFQYVRSEFRQCEESYGNVFGADEAWAGRMIETRARKSSHAH